MDFLLYLAIVQKTGCKYLAIVYELVVFVSSSEVHDAHRISSKKLQHSESLHKRLVATCIQLW